MGPRRIQNGPVPAWFDAPSSGPRNPSVSRLLKAIWKTLCQIRRSTPSSRGSCTRLHSGAGTEVSIFSQTGWREELGRLADPARKSIHVMEGFKIDGGTYKVTIL